MNAAIIFPSDRISCNTGLALLPLALGEYHWVFGWGYCWTSSALKALSSAKKLMQNTWISIPRIILSGSRAGSDIGPYPEIVGGAGVAKQFPTFSFQHGAWRNKMSGIFKHCTAKLAGWVTTRDCPFFRVLIWRRQTLVRDSQGEGEFLSLILMSGGSKQGNGSLSRVERERRSLEHT